MSDTPDYLQLTTQVVTAFVSKNSVSARDLPGVIASTHAALAASAGPETTEAEPAGPRQPSPAEIRRSIRPDNLVSFEDGRAYKILKPHLKRLGMSLDDYRTKWGLPADYPSTAPSYSAMRSAGAKERGFGRRPAPLPEPSPEPAPARRSRKKTS